MSKRYVGGELIEVGPMPIFAKRIGFVDANHVERVAMKCGKIVSRMKETDVNEYFKENKV